MLREIWRIVYYRYLRIIDYDIYWLVIDNLMLNNIKLFDERESDRC